MPLLTPAQVVPAALLARATHAPAEQPPPVWQTFAVAQACEDLAVHAPAPLHENAEYRVAPVQ
jgi:hypothetical protein